MAHPRDSFAGRHTSQPFVAQWFAEAPHIRLEDLPDYQSVTLFNAMLDFGEVQLPVSAIHTEPVK